jgi:DcuC family C4-dicarboxylate transporter
LALAIPVALIIAVLHAFVQRYVDKKEGLSAGQASAIETESRLDPKVAALPAYYALFPLVPLVLLILFNKLVWKTIVLDTATAMIIGWFLAIVVDLLRSRDVKKTFDDSMAMFSGMGAILTSVVSLIFVADFFSNGLQASGLINMLMDAAKASGTGVTGSTIVLSACVGFIALLTGSGVAAFTSLVGLVMPLAQSVGGDPGAMILPIQFASEMIRPVSPVAGVIIIVAGAAKVSPIAIAKREAIPMGVGMLAVLVLNYILFA